MFEKSRRLRRPGGALVIVALAGLLVACGGESNSESTQAPDPTATVTTEPTSAAPVESAATEVPSSVASPVASPIVALAASPLASPVSALASSPVASPIVSPMASPVAGPVRRTTWVLEGTVMLPGKENEQFVISGDGCVGLGEYAGVEAGQQVVIKSATGSVIGITTLAASGNDIDCVWTFDAEVPVSDFYIVSLPLLFERVYSDADMALLDGQLQIELP